MVKKGPPERTQPVRLDFQCDYKSGISRSPLPTQIPVQIVLILRRVNFLIEIESVIEHERTLFYFVRPVRSHHCNASIVRSCRLCPPLLDHPVARNHS